MKRSGWLALTVALTLVVAACSGGSKNGGDSLSGGSSTTGANDACKGETLEASEIGISATDIKVTVLADVGSPLRPGLFQGSMDGVNAWADYINDNGGLACRQVTVVEADSKLSPDEAKNGVTAACQGSVVLLGTTALFLNDMRPAENCKDKAGAATGIPDLPVLQTEPVEQCSDISFAVIPNGGSCPYSGKGVRTFKSVTPAIEWFKTDVSDNLHGVFVVPQDLPSTITASTPLYAAIEKGGVKRDSMLGASALWTQSQYTPVIQAIKSNQSTYVQNGLAYGDTVKMRKEALQQGVDSVDVWACSLQCYDPKFITEGGTAVEKQYSWFQFLPFEDAGSNDMLDAFLKYDKKPDGFGVQAFAAGLLFQQVVEAIVAKDGPNGITRQAILDQVRTVNDFDAGGLLVKTDIAGKNPSPCIVIVQVEQGAWKRVNPTEKGKFDCDQPSAIIEHSLDPLKAYKPS